MLKFCENISLKSKNFFPTEHRIWILVGAMALASYEVCLECLTQPLGRGTSNLLTLSSFVSASPKKQIVGDVSSFYGVSWTRNISIWNQPSSRFPSTYIPHCATSMMFVDQSLSRQLIGWTEVRDVFSAGGWDNVPGDSDETNDKC